MKLQLIPDMSIEPGHQWIVLPGTLKGAALAMVIVGSEDLDESYYHQESDGTIFLRIPHNELVDQNIIQLVNELAHVRFSAPGLVQLTLTEGEPS